MVKEQLQKLLDATTELAHQAGDAILPFFHNKKSMNVQSKVDNTPVTDADLRANEIILQGLAQLTPTIPIISEESDIPDFSVRRDWDYCWLVDPLDGTKGFINGSGEFTVNIALIHQHEPILGVIYAPVKQVSYRAAKGLGVFCRFQQGQEQIIQCNTLENISQARVVLGQYHTLSDTHKMVESLSQHDVLRVNSSIKFGWLAESKADFYPRFGPTGEWDTAAGHCIVQQAGGIVVDLEGNSLQYNASESILNPAFIALGDRSLLGEVLHTIKQRREK